MKHLLKTHFGYDAFRPLQEDIMNTVLGQKDALVLMPTGGGKSLCFQLPALMFPGITLVISPLIALMKDQVDSLTANGISAAFINSTLTDDEMQSVESRALPGELKILYVAPERLPSPAFRRLLEQLTVSLIAIDEAHCISEWGHDFRPDYRNLKDLRSAFPSVPVMALTATATPRVRDDIVKQLSMQEASVFLSSFNRPNLSYSVVPKSNSFGQLVDRLRKLNDQPAIVYCFSRKDTESLAADLTHAGLRALPYHAGLERDLRRETQERFIRDEVPIIVATIAFGMGIDKPDVRLVAHMDLPKTIEGYYQETGRAGRDGLPSECVLFYTYGDKRKQEFFIMQIADEDERELAQTKLNQVVAYCESDSCRRQTLLRYFGEPWPKVLSPSNGESSKCDACDNCVQAPVESRDATEISQKILSAVLRTGEAFGAAYVIDVLRGSRKERIVENHHDDLPVHGIGRDVSVDSLRECFRLLQKKGYLEKTEGDYPTLRVSRMGKTALAAREVIELPVSIVTNDQAGLKSLGNRSSRSSSAAAGSVAYDAGLFEILRRERKSIADERHVPPFVIFGDKTLQEMAYYFPRSTDSLSSVFGVGAKKLEEFGDTFLGLIREYAEANDRAERKHPKASQEPSVGSSSDGSATIERRGGSTVFKTKELIENKLSLAQIAESRGLSEGTVVTHIAALLQEDDSLDIEHLRPSDDRMCAISDAFEKTGGAFLSPVKTLLGDDYSYDEIKLARLFL